MYPRQQTGGGASILIFAGICVAAAWAYICRPESGALIANASGAI